jgi:hypothetical protein
LSGIEIEKKNSDIPRKATVTIEIIKIVDCILRKNNAVVMRSKEKFM